MKYSLSCFFAERLQTFKKVTESCKIVTEIKGTRTMLSQVLSGTTVRFLLILSQQHGHIRQRIEGMRVMKIEAPNGAFVRFLLIHSANKPSKQEVDRASVSAISFPDIDLETNQCVCEVESRFIKAAVAFWKSTSETANTDG
jgi:hypothetical protein